MTDPTLREELHKLTGEQRWMVLLALVGAAPDEVRHALDVERATRVRAEGDACVAALIAGQAEAGR
jgi:hypothetical protein